jgi:hypothetical protein
MDSNENAIYFIEITISHSQKSIERRFLIPSDFSLLKLNETINILFGLPVDRHYKFEINGKNYYCDEYDENTETDIYTGAKLKIKKLLNVNDSFSYSTIVDEPGGYLYELKIVGSSSKAEDIYYPNCTSGRGNSPPSFLHSINEYPYFLELYYEKIVKSKSSEAFDFFGEMVTKDDFDPDYFDLDKLNRNLYEHFKLK